MCDDVWDTGQEKTSTILDLPEPVLENVTTMIEHPVTGQVLGIVVSKHPRNGKDFAQYIPLREIGDNVQMNRSTSNVFVYVMVWFETDSQPLVEVKNSANMACMIYRTRNHRICLASNELQVALNS
ncbi:hypothetical protein KIN20_005075 [Parelaphostrongylus tenuis]|uniref:Uncharacterized protein n=1 Tax=Parelaphostrongylus tenuis TaxID=148309 RepID=A0AAD5QIC7_PARTN|nr:hypothetical protein KIN20_005075 [Parelaphostrongylus tenuis]